MTGTTIGHGLVAPAVEFAGFWRRIGAALLDTILLGMVGWIIGTMAQDWLLQLGPQARLLGLPLSLAYVTIGNSRFGGGGTLGKHALGIAVVGRGGAAISLSRSLWRGLVYQVPFYVNGYDFGFIAMTPLAMTAVGGIAIFLVFGVAGSDVYLYLANWRTRQIAHDLAAGTFVVRKASAGVPVRVRINRLHLAVIAVLLALPLAAIPAGYAYLGGDWLGGLSRSTGVNFDRIGNIQTAVNGEDGVLSSGVILQTSNFSSFKGGASVTHSLVVTVVHRGALDEPEPFADRIAARVLKVAPDAMGMEVLTVVVRVGYDIGISSSWRSQNFSHTPAEWRARLSGAKDVAPKPKTR